MKKIWNRLETLSPVTPAELRWAEAFLEKHRSPLKRQRDLIIALLPWIGVEEPGREPRVQDWDLLVSQNPQGYRFWQFGIENDSAIQGCEFYFLYPGTVRNLRRFQAVLARTNGAITDHRCPRPIQKIVPPACLTGFPTPSQLASFLAGLKPRSSSEPR